MCGIFGFILKKPLSINKVFGVLKKLETSKYIDEEFPLGGFGAGIAVMFPDGDIINEKVGKAGDSPAAELEAVVKNLNLMNAKLSGASVLLGLRGRRPPPHPGRTSNPLRKWYRRHGHPGYPRPC